MGASKSRTFVTGNIKFDYTLPDGLIKKAIQFKKEFALDREIWVAGSTHKGEEKIILRAHERILETFPAFSFFFFDVTSRHRIWQNVYQDRIWKFQTR